MGGCGGGVTNEEEERKRKRGRRVQWTGSIRNEFPEMATHGWVELAWIREVEVGWGVERLLHVQLDRKRERQRPLGDDRCSPPLQLRPRSWPGSLDISLYIFLPSSPCQTHALTLRVTHTTSYAMLHHVRCSSFYMASLPTRQLPQFITQLS